MAERLQNTVKHAFPLGTLVVGVDIGTSRTALSLTRVGREQTTVQLIPLEQGRDETKSPTTLLLEIVGTNDDGDITSIDHVNLVAFGLQAQQEFKNLDPDELGDHLYCEFFKMHLHNPDEVDPWIVYPTRKIRLCVVLVLLMKKIKCDAIRFMQDHGVSDASIAETVWAVTVPAIWSDRAKEAMRSCAVQSGLINKWGSNNLVLCLEPEGVCFAAVYSAHQQKELKDLLMTRGLEFIVLDCGGGTIDITAHRVRSAQPFCVESLVPPSGGPFGSMTVDGKFMDLIRAVIGADLYEECITNMPQVHNELRQTVVQVKQNFTGGSRVVKLNVRCLTEVLQAKQQDLKTMVDAYNAANPTQHKLGCKSVVMTIPSAKVMEFFESTAADVIRLLDVYCAQPELAKTKHILLAGGFSESMVFRSLIARHFEAKDYKVITVNRPDLAIVIGAAIFATGHKSRIVSRVAPMTYGVSASREYDAEIDSSVSDHSFLAEGRRKIDIFSIHKRQGEPMDVNDRTPARCYKPLSPMQVVCSQYLLRCDDAAFQSPTYQFDQGVEVLGKYDVQWDMTVPLEQRQFSVEFEFGGTEIKAHITTKDRTWVERINF